MVHDLQTIIRLNAPRPGAKAAVTPKPFVPERIALNPAAAKQYLNRPWTKEELGGKESVFESYARSEREPFRNREPASEQARI